MLFKDIHYLELWLPFCSAPWNHFDNFGREHYEEQFCEIIKNFGQWFKRCSFKDFLSRALAALLFNEAKPFMQIQKRATWGTSCNVIDNLDQWFRRRCCLEKKIRMTDRLTITIANHVPSAQVN